MEACPPLHLADGPPGLSFGRGSRGGTLLELKRAVNAAFKRLKTPSAAWRKGLPRTKPSPRPKPRSAWTASIWDDL